MSSGFTKTFRFIALVLLLSVMQVYVLAHPATTSTTFATKNTEAVSNPVVTGHQLNFINQKQVATSMSETNSNQAQLASERNLTFAPKSPLSLAFTKASGEKAATKSTFLKVKKGTYDLMMSPKGQPTSRPAAQDDDDDDDDGDRKALYIASALVIGAAVAAFIGFRSDRDNDNIRGN